MNSPRPKVLYCRLGAKIGQCARATVQKITAPPALNTAILHQKVFLRALLEKSSFQLASV